MIGTWRWNVGFAAVGGMMSLLFSMSGNTFAVSCVKGIYAFAAFFIMAFLFRAVLRMVVMPQPSVSAIRPDEQDSVNEAGSTFEAVIPDESDQLHEMLKSNPNGRTATASAVQQSNQFQPLKPPKLVSTQNKDPEELAKAVRHLTGG
jgi:hypothetical protein